MRALAGSGVQRRLLLSVAGLLLAVSLANPTLTLPRNVYDFLFVVDITGSMNVADAGDGGQRRLTFARQLVRKAVEELPCGSRAGLAVFTEHRSFLLFAPVEICENNLVISTMIGAIDERMAWAELSEVAKGLYSGIEAIETLAALGPEAGATRLVFMTDGHEAPPVHPTLRPKFRGEPGAVRGLIAGIGGAKAMPIPYLDADGQVVGYWSRDEVLQVDRHSLGRPSTEGEAMVGIDNGDVQERIARGTEHLSSLREDYLVRLAAETGLDYLRTGTEEAFARALLDSRYAEQQPVETRVAWIPAGSSLLCLLYVFGAQLLRARHRRGQAGVVSRETGVVIRGARHWRRARRRLPGGAAPRRS